jgi:tRNA(Ile)-lysidine synthetase-like protein
MEIAIPKGRYVLAVSGGVDSMVLLDALRKSSDLELIVAHFNHGIRRDSNLDEKMVRQCAQKYGLEFEVGREKMGKASEEQARNARYRFLRQVQKSHYAKAIITAHHQDDVIETAIINVLRGTGRRGLSSIARSDILRPLLNTPKSNLYDYAKKNKLIWREDSTNQQTDYLRNYIRQKVIPKMTSKERQGLLSNIDNLVEIDKQTDKLFATLSLSLIKNDKISRAGFIMLPLEVAAEMLISTLAGRGIKNYDRKLVDRLLMVIKTARPGSLHDINGSWQLKVEKEAVYFSPSG